MLFLCYDNNVNNEFTQHGVPEMDGKTTMDETRMGKIALKLVLYRMRKTGLQIDEFNRELGNLAKATSIPIEEPRQFFEAILPELLGQMLGRKSVSLITSG